MKRSIIAALVLGLCVSGSVALAASSVAESNAKECSAPKSYTSQLNSALFLNKANQDFSCLVDYASISSQKNQYQLVDVRQLPATSVVDAWIIPFDDLKHKSFLKNRHLLLLDDGFSRVDAAQNCFLLKKKGFQNTKILVGGADLWSHLKAGKNKPRYENRVDAKKLLIEYFNGSIHLIASSAQVVDKLQSLGFPLSVINKIDKYVSITDVVIQKAVSGMDAVIYISEDGKIPSDPHGQIYNLYVLEGGVESLAYEMTKQRAIEQARLRDQEPFFCAQ